MSLPGALNRLIEQRSPSALDFRPLCSFFAYMSWYMVARGKEESVNESTCVY